MSEAEERRGQRLFSPFTHRSHFVDVPHVRQSFDWDCGLACVLMVLKTLGINRCDDICDLEQLCCTRSIWTVDLAYLLQKFSVKFSFFTVTLGANPDFSEKTFYREQLQDDSCRVDGLFQKALEAGISIQCRSISGQEISVLILSGQYIAIALVDKIKLRSGEDCMVSSTGCRTGHNCTVFIGGYMYSRMLCRELRLYGTLCGGVWLRC